MTEPTESLPGFSLEVEGKKGRAVRLGISGHISLDNLVQFRSQLESFLSSMNPASLCVDLAGVEFIDSAAALALMDLKAEAEAQSISCSFEQASEQTKGVIGLIEPEVITMAPLRSEEQAPDFFTQLGDATRLIMKDFYDLQSFLGELLFALAYCFRHPGSVRWMDVFFYMKRAGVDALPILSVMSLGTGAVIAFLSALQLKLVGATIFVAALIAVAVVQELGPLLTVILVSGRSSSAFAAEIGTMEVGEEVDALETMGLNPIRFLVVPKYLAMLVMMPCLTVVADTAGVLGGAFFAITNLDSSLSGYLLATVDALVLRDIVTGLVKSLVFAVIITKIGCYEGFSVRGGAEGVGRSTTSAVVKSIFSVIAADMIFTAIFYFTNGG